MYFTMIPSTLKGSTNVCIYLISVLLLQKWWGCDSAKVFGHTKIISIIGCCDALKQPTWGCLARFGVGEDVQGAVERNQDVALKG